MLLEPHRIGRQEFLLEALIIVLEFYRSSPAMAAASVMEKAEIKTVERHPVPGNSIASSFRLNQRLNEPETKPPTTTSTTMTMSNWRQKLMEPSNENIRPTTTTGILRYSGSKSSHQLVLNISENENNARFQNINLSANLSNRYTPTTDIMDRARCRSSETEPEHRHLTSWRQRLREQQEPMLLNLFNVAVISKHHDIILSKRMRDLFLRLREETYDPLVGLKVMSLNHCTGYKMEIFHIYLLFKSNVVRKD